ncbi:MAG: hypothetical protein NC200_08660 [Candidatus Gastranaerophilales bacterium]|nr:hypothetical protein [Candidatus Gastranaerophilales bacterium]
MIKSILFSALGAALITFGVGFYVNSWFLADYNWLWLAIPAFWLSYQIFSRLFKVLDILIGIVIIAVIVILKTNGINLPTL